jgi:hypothetical protein
VVDASDKIVLNGGTDPKALHILYDKGVRIFSKERLHAKVMVLGKTLFLGSANVSSNSKYSLHEAVIQTASPKIVGESVNYIINLPKKELDGKELKYLTGIYSPPTHLQGKVKHRVANSQFRLYASVIDYIGFSEGTEDFLRKGKVKAIQEVAQEEKLDIVEVVTDESTVSLEFILQMEKRGDDYFVYPPSEVIHKELIPSKKLVLLFMVRKKGKKGRYKKDIESNIRPDINTEYWLSETLSKKIMELWNMSFN